MKRIIRMNLLRTAIGTLVATVLLATAAHAQWPTRPIRIIVPVVPGSFTDLAARALGAELGEQLGQQVVVENRPGAGTTLGADLVAKAAPDGHTLLISENSFTISPALYPKLGYDPLKDFAHITLVAEAPTIFVTRLELPVKTPRELVELARAKPGEISFGSGGQGTSSHLAGELFFEQTKLKVVHVPFKGVAASMAEIVGGRVDFGGSSVASPIGLIRAGKIRPLAVTGRERSPLLPEVPTFAESGFPDFDAPIWWGFLAPARTPPEILSRLHEEFVRAIARPKIKETFAAQGARAFTTSAAEFTRRIERELTQWRALITRVGVKVE